MISRRIKFRIHDRLVKTRLMQDGYKHSNRFGLPLLNASEHYLQQGCRFSSIPVDKYKSPL